MNLLSLTHRDTPTFCQISNEDAKPSSKRQQNVFCNFSRFYNWLLNTKITVVSLFFKRRRFFFAPWPEIRDIYMRVLHYSQTKLQVAVIFDLIISIISITVLTGTNLWLDDVSYNSSLDPQPHGKPCPSRKLGIALNPLVCPVTDSTDMILFEVSYSNADASRCSAPFCNYRVYASVQTDSVLLSQILNHCSWIRSHGQQADQWSSRITFLPRALEIQDHRISVLWSHRVRYVLARLCRSSVRAPWSSMHEDSMSLTPNIYCQCISLHIITPLGWPGGVVGWRRSHHFHGIADYWSNFHCW